MQVAGGGNDLGHTQAHQRHHVDDARDVASPAPTQLHDELVVLDAVHFVGPPGAVHVIQGHLQEDEAAP